MDFSKFVDMVVHGKLTLVSPELWEDPLEKAYFSEYIIQNSKLDKSGNNQDGGNLKYILEYIVSLNTYALCWTRLEESDALWRIYSDNNQSVRIAVEESSLNGISGCVLNQVQYKNLPEDENLLDYSYYDLISMKRKAFKHEEEIRLISHLKFPRDFEGVEEYIEAFYLIYGGNENTKFKTLKLEDFEVEIKKAIKLINADSKKKIKKISIEPVEKFVCSVQLHPQAKPWQDEMMKTFCERFNLNYIGKSKLYERN